MNVTAINSLLNCTKGEYYLFIFHLLFYLYSLFIIYFYSWMGILFFLFKIFFWLISFTFMKAQLWHLAQRTTSLPLGRGAFTLATIYTLLTEVLFTLNFFFNSYLPSLRNLKLLLEMYTFLSVMSWILGFYSSKACISWSVASPTECYRKWILYSWHYLCSVILVLICRTY